jgi:signal transduction histidine kinase
MTSRTRVPIDLTVEGQGSIPPNLQIALYRIAQEALNNMAKYAGASRATVHLTCGSPQVTLSVRDDGRGFNPGDVLPDQLGISIMHERAEAAGATLQMNSQPGQGTEILVAWQQFGEQ